jgi:hypothetical protein
MNSISNVVPLFRYLVKQNTIYVSDLNNPADVDTCGSQESPCRSMRYVYETRLSDHLTNVCLFKIVTELQDRNNSLVLISTSKSAEFFGVGGYDGVGSTRCTSLALVLYFC